MKLFKFIFSAVLFILLSSSAATAYIGLCCAHCGGNMPLNIMGGGIPETHEYRFKISEMYMSCLLYTSPSPRDGLLSRMPSSA